MKFKHLVKIIVFVLIVGGVFLYYYADKFYPNTYINGVNVGGMTYLEAQIKVQSVFEDIKENGFNLEFVRESSSRKVNIPSVVSGFTPDTVVEYFTIGDIEDVFKDAYGRGREGNVFKRWFSKLVSPVFSKTFIVPHFIQKEAVFSLLNRELNGFLNTPKNAEFVWAGGKMVVSDEKFGADIDHEKIVEAMNSALFNADIKSLWFGVNLISPAITAQDLEPKLDFVNALVNRPVNLEFQYEPYWWRARGIIFSSWLSLNESDKNKFEIISEKLVNFFRMNVDYPPVDVKMTNSRFEMRSGKLVEIVPGRSGLEVDFSKLKAEIESSIQKIYENNWDGKDIVGLKNGTLPMEFGVNVVEPKITKETIEKYQITDLIGRAKTSFAGSSAARIKNIKVGTAQLNGILLAPGEEFSAVDGIGVVDEEAGYTKEYVIKGDKSVEEYGGGLCQVGTTLFRLALDAGLPVTERQNHSYVVGYYGPGLDATIYGPHPDLRFVNDTENYILLQGIVSGTDLIFELYGKKDGRKPFVSEVRTGEVISPPDTKFILTADLPAGQKKCTERRRNGLTTEVDYIVEYANSDVKTQTFTSVYKPWQEVCLLGTGI